MDFILKGDIAYSKNSKEINTMKDGYLICLNGISQGVFEKVPEQYQNLPVHDYSGKLVMPGMTDLHIHAPQYAFRGMYMDEELLDWLKKYTFPEEAKFADLEYARKSYGMFAEQMRKSATTRAVIFGTVHRDATEILMDEMEKSGLCTYVGKVNMDRDAPEELLDASAEESARDTVQWLMETVGRYEHTRPILTPRFIPCCTEELLKELQVIVDEYKLPVQSHLSENPGEVELVHKLMPDTAFYGEGYDKYHLFGSHSKTIMAHCVYSVEEEVDLMNQNRVYVAHCPSSNRNLSSGIAPVRKYLDQGVNVGLGSDVAAGESESIFSEIRSAVGMSKMYRRYVDPLAQPLTIQEAFWLATVSGGSFFGKVGSFEAGYEVDAIVLDETSEPHPQPLGILERVERSIYLGLDKNGIVAKYVQGRKLM